LIRLRIAPAFIHSLLVSGHPSGVCRPKIGCPSCATIRAVRGVASTSAFTVRSALVTSSNGDFTFARYAARLKNSGLVTIVRTTSRMSPSVRWKVSAARATSDGGGESLTNRTTSLCAM
jgi:hypothetical protein